MQSFMMNKQEVPQELSGRELAAINGGDGLFQDGDILTSPGGQTGTFYHTDDVRGVRSDD